MDGTVAVRSQGDLDRLLSCPVFDLSTEIISFIERHWLQLTASERVAAAAFLTSAREQVIREGRLPTPDSELPPVGARCESLVISRKPGSDRRYGVGWVTGHEWVSVNRAWAIDTTFDEPEGTHYGMPIQGTQSGVDEVYIIGGPGPAWSEMTPAEIDGWLESRRR